MINAHIDVCLKPKYDKNMAYVYFFLQELNFRVKYMLLITEDNSVPSTYKTLCYS